MRFFSILFLFSAFFNVGCVSSNSNKTPEITFDGLVQQKNTAFKRVWAAPNIDLSLYKSIIPKKADISFRATRGRGSQSNGFPVTDIQKQALIDIIGTVLLEEISANQRFKLSDTPGPDTLILDVSLLDIVSLVPPEVRGRGDIYLSRIGEITLVLELRDSSSGEVLLRAAERGVAEPAGSRYRLASRVTNRSEVQRLARRWGIKIRKGLNAIE